MSAYDMKPVFTDWNGYQHWMQSWRVVYKHLSDVCRARKKQIKAANREHNWEALKAAKKKYDYDKVMSTKMMTLRNEAIIRWNNILTMYKGLNEQANKLPIIITDAKNIDFYFNKKHLEFPKIPMWIIRAKGQSFYVNHLDCLISWSTKEKPDDQSTKGMIRIKRGNVHIDKSGSAIIS